MMNALTYKGYAAQIECDDADRIFVGRLAGIRDIVGFHASTVDARQAASHESVDDYVEACKKLGQPAEN